MVRKWLGGMKGIGLARHVRDAEEDYGMDN